MNEAISGQPTAPQGENKGKGNVRSPWTRVSLDHLEKTAAVLKQIEAEKKGTVAPKKKKGK